MLLRGKSLTKADWVKFILSAFVFTFIILFFYLPVTGVLKYAFKGSDGSLTLSNIVNTVQDPYNRRIIAFTIKQAVLSTVFAVLLGFPGAFILARVKFKGKSVVRAVSMIPFVLPSILVVLGFVIFFGNNGYLNRFLELVIGSSDPPLKILYSMKAIILAHGFYNFPIAMRIIASLWERLGENQLHAAKSLGAGRAEAFFTVTLPQLLPAVLSAFGIIFLFCFSSFAVILVLGGGPAYSTIEVEIYRLAKVSLNLRAASSLAVIGIVFSMIFMYLTIRFQSSVSRTEDLSTAAPAEYKKSRVLLPVYVFVILFLVAAPIGSVIIKSFRMPVTRAGSDIFTLRWYTGLFSRGFGSASLSAVKNSIVFAVSAAAIAVPAGTVLSYFSVKNWLGNRTLTSAIDTLLMLPMIVSSVILGLGYMILRKNLPPYLSESGIPVIMAHAIIAYPFVVRSVTGVLRKIKPSLIHAASSMGASPAAVFLTVELPIIKGALLTGAAFAFALSMGELNATILLAGSDTATIPLAVYRLIGSYNFYGACAMGTILIILTIIVFTVMDKIGSNKGRDLLWD